MSQETNLEPNLEQEPQTDKPAEGESVVEAAVADQDDPDQPTE